MSEPDYKAFYEAIIVIAEELQTMVESTMAFSTSEMTLMLVIARNIVFAAEEHVPGGLHTEVFNINYKED